MKLLLAGGGTGGHLFPAIAIAQRLLQQDSANEVLFVGTERGIEARVLPQLHLPLKTIDIAGFVGKNWQGKLALLPKVWTSFRQSLRIINRFDPDMVLGVGGYASGPVLLAAKWVGVPYLIHEQNARPGLTNRLLGRWARRVCLSFPGSESFFPAEKTELTGNPVRQELTQCKALQPTGSPRLLVFGGSQGARAINQAMVAALPLLKHWQTRLQIIHQTGAADFERVRDAYTESGWPGVEVTLFIDDMPAALAGAQLVVCRAGATTLAELTVAGRPAILVPYPHAAGDHQAANARALADRGAAVHLPESELDAESLVQAIEGLLQNQEKLVSMAASARRAALPEATDRILALCRIVLAEKD